MVLDKCLILLFATSYYWLFSPSICGSVKAISNGGRLKFCVLSLLS